MVADMVVKASVQATPFNNSGHWLKMAKKSRSIRMSIS
jgi:hypothetical protein